MVTRSVVQSAMHTAAMALAQLPSEEWPGWIAYLCETLEQMVEGQDLDIEAVLQEVEHLLQARVQHGSW